jgi:hypothetical protein
LRFGGGLTNSGALTFTSGVSEVFGDVAVQNNLTTPGRIIVSGGAQANFYDDVTNSGLIQVSAAGSLASTAVFLGSLTGSGVSGSGHVFNEGDMRPGFSPGTMAFGGDLSFGPLASLEIELAGHTPGTQFDRVTVANTVALSGELDVALLSTFQPDAGDTFEILHADGGVTGTFSTEALPALRGGLYFDVQYAANSVTLFTVGALGDYNRNGRVDAADYTVWRNALNQPVANLLADGSGDHQITRSDFDVWKAHFGEIAMFGAGALSAAVPEPASATLLLSVIAAFGVLCRRREM